MGSSCLRRPAPVPRMRVAATGGTATTVRRLGPLEQTHAWPQFLSDSRRFLFWVGGGPDTAGIYVGALDGSAPTRLTPSDSAGMYLIDGSGPAEGGWLLWGRAGTLVSHRLDLAKAALVGEPVTIADGMAVVGGAEIAVSVAATGLVAYRTGEGTQRQLSWFDRSGTARGTAGDPDGNDLCGPRVSPDGHRVIAARTVRGNTDGGCSTAPARAGSRSMRRSIDIPSGRPTALASCSTHSGRAQATCTGSARVALMWRSRS